MVEVIGDQWRLLIIRDIMFMNRRYFRELLTKSLEGIATNILADRLQRLVKQGIKRAADSMIGARGYHPCRLSGK